MRLWSEPEAARADLQRSIALGRELGDNWAVADGLKMMTVTWLMQENHTELADAAEELRMTAERLGNKFFLSWHRCVLGWSAVRRGELNEGREALEASIELCQEVGEPVTAGIAVAMLAEADLVAGAFDAARRRLKAFIPKASARGGAQGVPVAQTVLAGVALATGDAGGARQILDRLVPSLEALGAPVFASWAGSLLGASLLALGDIATASTTLATAERAGLALGNDWLVALARYHLAEAARLADDLRRAEDLHHDALAARVRGGFAPGIADSLEGLASVAVRHQSFAEAARLLGSAHALRLSRKFAPTSGLALETKALTQEALGDEGFAVPWAEGQALTLDEALSYAVRARGERKRPTTGWESLTPTERSVVKLVAEGLTNPQIGDRLFIGGGTVKTHLAHAFAKLGIRSRSQLAAEVARRQL
jgi:DNA-binding CsgD family transcriptional regulator